MKSQSTDTMKTGLLLLLLSLTIPTLSHATAAYPSVPGTTPADCSFSDGDTNTLIPPRREVYGDGRIFDITHRIIPGTPSFRSPDGVLGQFLWLHKSMKNSSLSNTSVFKLPTHTGTHVDSPGHFIDHYLDAGFDVDTLDLEVLNGPALLVDVPRDKNITGIDYLSVAAFDDLLPGLVFLESREIILVEALKLDDIQAGIYSVHCLPLRLQGAEGSPIRCILIK